MPQTKRNSRSNPPSRLQMELAGKILRLIKANGFGLGHRLVEADLCTHFNVSRSPIRAALSVMAEHGLLQQRANRGFTVARTLDDVSESTFDTAEDEDDKLLFIAIAQAHLERRLPDTCTQQELVRMFDVGVNVVVRVMRQLSELGLVERKPGNGWSFLPSIDTQQTQRESYDFRLALEPEAILQKGFNLPKDLLADMRKQHEEFRMLEWTHTMAVDFFEMNASFHLTLTRASHNRYFEAAIEQQNTLRRFLNYKWDFGIERVYASIDEHLEVLSALERGDRELASVLMRRHLMQAGNTPGRLENWPG